MKIAINNQKILSFSIAYMVSFLALLNVINAITNWMGFNTTLDTMVLYGGLWVMAAYVWINSIYKKACKTDVIVLLLTFIILVVVSYLFFPANRVYIHSSL